MTDLDTLRASITSHVGQLIAAQRHDFTRADGTTDTSWSPGLLRQLEEAIMADTGRPGRGRGHAPIPISAEALDLKTEIATYLGVRPADLAHWIATLPDVVTGVRDPDWLTVTGDTLAWACNAINTLLNPPRSLEAVEPCPACGIKTVHRQDAAGDTVRIAALRLSVNGCRCQHCGAHWPPEQLEHLALVLGCQPIS